MAGHEIDLYLTINKPDCFDAVDIKIEMVYKKDFCF